jgi:hypothetical protein
MMDTHSTNLSVMWECGHGFESFANVRYVALETNIF